VACQPGNRRSILKTRADQIYNRFMIFHLENPQIWELFCRFANERKEAGFTKYSSDAIKHRIKWEVATQTTSILSDHYTAYYARMYLLKYPEMPDFFILKKRSSTERPAFKNDIAFPDLPPPGDEEIDLWFQLMDLLEA